MLQETWHSLCPALGQLWQQDTDLVMRAGWQQPPQHQPFPGRGTPEQIPRVATSSTGVSPGAQHSVWLQSPSRWGCPGPCLAPVATKLIRKEAKESPYPSSALGCSSDTPWTRPAVPSLAQPSPGRDCCCCLRLPRNFSGHWGHQLLQGTQPRAPFTEEDSTVP